MPPFWLAVPEIPGWAAGSSEAWSSNGSGDGNSNSNSNSNSGEAGARRLQPAHLLQVSVQTETAHRQRADQARVAVAAAQLGPVFVVHAVPAVDQGRDGQHGGPAGLDLAHFALRPGPQGRVDGPRCAEQPAEPPS